MKSDTLNFGECYTQDAHGPLEYSIQLLQLLATGLSYVSYPQLRLQQYHATLEIDTSVSTLYDIHSSKNYVIISDTYDPQPKYSTLAKPSHITIV